MPFSHHSYPRAIMHVDGDSFFASCEIAKDPSLKGKPVITGRERGIASAMSYEAKRRGVTRGMRLSDIKKVCPDAVILPSDYETYSLYSKRMYETVRRFTPSVEEYSIDECFADLTGMRRPLHMSYEAIATEIKRTLEIELGMTFSVGLSATKVLAKVASKWNKPSGLVFIPLSDTGRFLSKTPVGKIWGIGGQTSALLNKYGIKTALDFASRREEWIKEILSKPFWEIWRELRGEVVYELVLEEKHDYQSISKTKTFTPPSTDRTFVFSQLSKNIENACIKARRHSLAARKAAFFLKTQDFRYRGLEIDFSSPTSVPGQIVALVREHFDEVFRQGRLYRATGVVLFALEGGAPEQLDLFGQSAKIENIRKVYEAVDALSEKFGKHAVFLGSSLTAMTTPSHKGDRKVLPGRSTAIFKGENRRQRLAIPYLGQAS